MSQISSAFGAAISMADNFQNGFTKCCAMQSEWPLATEDSCAHFDSLKASGLPFSLQVVIQRARINVQRKGQGWAPQRTYERSCNSQAPSNCKTS